MTTDSAATLRNIKTYTGVNKLFMLINDHFMRITIHDNADFVNMPFEALIKKYRSKIMRKIIKDIMKNFLESITNYINIFRINFFAYNINFV